MQNKKYKTSKCRHFETNGSCSLGVNCSFAHGDAELRMITDVSLLLNNDFSLYLLKHLSLHIPTMDKAMQTIKLLNVKTLNLQASI